MNIKIEWATKLPTMEELEFNICEYLDGALSEPDRAAVEAILESNAVARELLEAHRRLNAALKSLPPAPSFRWERQAAQVSAAIDDAEKLEFAISQYVDGTLDNADRQAIEARLADDDYARSVHSHHDRLTSALRSLQSDSQIQWGALTDRISASIDRHQSEPAQSFKLFPWRSAMPFAMAASLLIAVGVAVSIYMKSPAVHPHGTTPSVAVASIIEVSGPAAQVAVNPVVDVQIGPAHSVTAAAMASRYDDDVVSRPARLIIASSAKPNADPVGLPY